MSCGCENNKVKTVKIADVAVDTLNSLPDYILAERDVLDESTGETKRTLVREPADKLFPNANNDNVTGEAINNLAITVPAGQVRAGYIKNEVGMNTMQYAGTDHPAIFLMLGLHTDGVMRIQNSGFVVIPEKHSYIVDTQYYLGTNGEPVTDGTITGQPLFVPISDTKLAIDLDVSRWSRPTQPDPTIH